jgi:hypothetical protein
MLVGNAMGGVKAVRLVLVVFTWPKSANRVFALHRPMVSTPDLKLNAATSGPARPSLAYVGVLVRGREGVNKQRRVVEVRKHLCSEVLTWCPRVSASAVKPMLSLLRSLPLSAEKGDGLLISFVFLCGLCGKGFWLILFLVAAMKHYI